MENAGLMLEMESLKRFAMETNMKIQELELYSNMGILGDNMYNSLYDEIEERIVWSSERAIEVMERLKALEKNLE